MNFELTALQRREEIILSLSEYKDNYKKKEDFSRCAKE